ncbi:hypothetical protein GMOD_00008661 [Pyrenophora seminiperda CCB06]|uniref:Uncharacterized protein n=1 Tax=Pyrenophora seminiperda CCB06 TaxID=1302712 RepID=A0A3M7M8Z1_9PLEO|nr:hypothetical protein GMOD_00008661 [Pyrenophora seminiperda CCB06]
MTPSMRVDADRRIGLDSVRIWQCTPDGLKQQESKVEQKLEEIKNERKDKANAFSWTKQSTWIHIPVNDMKLCQDVLRLVCSDGQANELVQDDYWSEQLHEPVYPDEKIIEGEGDETMSEWRDELVKAPFMDMKAWRRVFEVKHGKWHLKKGRQPESDTDITNLILYMADAIPPLGQAL